MRLRWTGCKRRVEVELEMRVEGEVVAGHARDVDLVISFRVHFAKGILVQKIVALTSIVPPAFGISMVRKMS